ncbi:MAG: methylmalonyl-CoA mutase family protein [Flavobacteriales bacterium]|jgi:methylmalonyl-CoA mutase
MIQNIDFSEFSKPSLEQWHAAVLKELAGKPFDATLWNPISGISMEPYYHQSGRRLEHVVPTRKDWGIGQIIYFINEKDTNDEILMSLEGGVNFLHIIFPKTIKAVDFSLLFKNIFLNYIEVALSFHAEDLIAQLSQFYNDSDSVNWKGAVHYQVASPQLKADLYERYSFTHKNIHTLSVDASHVQNRGGNSIDAIVYACIEGKEILNILIEKGAQIDDLSAAMRFKFAIDTSYFQEIAKLKAFRIIWAEIIKAYQPSHSCSTNTIIDTTSTEYTMASLDAENNLLRTTVEAMAALIGGADTISLNTFNSLLDENQISSKRYARNILHLLKEESYFDMAREAVTGAYYIEELIYQMAAQALLRFQELAVLSHQEALDVLNKAIEASHVSKKDELENGLKTILGVNKYPNKKDPRLGSSVNAFEFERLSEKLENNLRNSNP